MNELPRSAPSIKTTELLVRLFRPYLRHIVLIGAVGFFGGLVTAFGASAVIPLLSLIIGDSADANSQFLVRAIKFFFSYLPFSYSVFSLLILIVVLFICKGAALYIFSYIRLHIVYDYRMKQMATLFSRMLHARWMFLSSQKMGYIQNVLLQDVDKTSSLLGSIAHFLLSLISAIVFLVVALTISVRITAATVIVGIVFALLARPLLSNMKRVRTEYSLESKNLFQFLIEHLIGLKSVKSTAVEEEVFERGKKQFDVWRWLELKGNLLRSLNKQSIEPASIMLIAGVFAFSYRDPAFNIQTFVAAMYLVQQTFRHFELLYGALQDMYESYPHAMHVLKFEERLTEEREAHHKNVKPFSFEHKLVFDRVSFRYPGMDRPVLSDLCLEIEKGKTYGLIGPSGVGKSTIADILIRLLEPQEGSLRIDDRDAKFYDIQSWRKAVAYVSQDVFLINDTIENNIKFYRGNIDRRAVEDAAKKAHIADFIATLPLEYQTVVGDRGVMLSGGQRQRVVLARALAGNPSVIVLDEATSALDNESEVAIERFIASLKGKVTFFIIAHRLTTLSNVDWIFIFEDGKTITMGKPEELLKDPNSYLSRMYALKQ